MRTTPSPQGKAMYVANQLASSWLLNVQRTLFARSKDNLDYVFRKLWGFIVDPRNLRIALARVAGNRGHRTAGVDGVTVRRIARDGIEDFLEGLRSELRSGGYRPGPVRRVLIPKPGQPGKFRTLGIPTVKDRVVQAALKNILEPVFEADFYPSSYGFVRDDLRTVRWNSFGCTCGRAQSVQTNSADSRTSGRSWTSGTSDGCGHDGRCHRPDRPNPSRRRVF